MNLFLVLLVVLGAIHGVASESMVPGLLTAISGGLLAVMAWLDSRGPGADGFARRAWPSHRSSMSRNFRGQMSMR
jgi:hypothetical protein